MPSPVAIPDELGGAQPDRQRDRGFPGGGQATIPQSTPWQGGQVNPFDIAGAEMNNYNIQAQNAANTNTGIFNTIGAIVGAANPLGGFSRQE